MTLAMIEDEDEQNAKQEKPPTFQELKEGLIKEVKQHRKDLDEVLQRMKSTQSAISRGPGGREIALSVTELQVSIMWLGMTLKELGAASPYPQGYNPENATVEPTADGLKL